MIGKWFALSAVLLFPRFLVAQSPASVQEAVGSITSADIIRRIGVIADDSMRGRPTPSAELEKTAAFIAGEFKRFGLQGGGDYGEYLQRYLLRNTGIDTAESSITIAGGPTLRFGPDAVPASNTRRADASGKVVILSGGKPDENKLHALNLSGSVALVLLSPDDPLGRENPYSRNLGMIAAQQPAAIIMVSPMDERQWSKTTRSSLTPTFVPTWQSGGGVPTGRPIIAVRQQSIRPILEQHGADFATLLKSRSGPPQATPVDLTISVTLVPGGGRNSSAPNVVGILEGSDSVLKDQYIVFSGHMDHIGMGQPNEQGDSIYNGADDDGSGTIAVVELAEAFSRLTPRPRRSLIFLTVSGEERGLWGSEFFTNNPPVPISGIVADLNTDMVGRNWKDTIVAIGKEHSDLGATLNRVNRQHPELGMTAIDDIWPNEDFYRRSDHFNFARKGVPILFFFNGTHPDYHGLGDEVSKIDGEKESRIVKLVFYLGLEIANAKEKPKWNPRSYKEIVEQGQ